MHSVLCTCDRCNHFGNHNKGEGMTDKELLELAAKAAGYEIRFSEYGGCRYEVSRRVAENDHAIVWAGWSPLTDDGDALRLAVELMKFEPYKSRGVLPFFKSSAEATRRAIVFAAAEIGKAL